MGLGSSEDTPRVGILQPIPGAGVAYDRTGTGPALALLHPLGSDRSVWAPVIGLLAAERDVIAVDLPGFGDSPPLAPGIVPHPRELAAAVIGLLTELGLDGGRAHLAGNSLGGWVALEAALAGAVASVTAIAPAGLWPRPLEPKRPLAHQIARAISPVAEIAMRPIWIRRAALLSSVAAPERLSPTQAAAMVRAYGGAPGFTATNEAMRAGTFTGLSEIPVPTTLVWPENDRLVSKPSQCPAKVRQIDLPGAGHIPMWDDPQAVADALLAGSAKIVRCD